MTVTVDLETPALLEELGPGPPRRARGHPEPQRPDLDPRRVGRIADGLAVARRSTASLAVIVCLGLDTVLSPSMEPTFGPGDLLITRAMPAAEIAVGDVLILPIPEGGSLTASTTVGDGAAAGDRYVHRVVAVTYRDGKPVLTTQGDNNEAVDPWQLQIDSAKVPAVVTSVPDVGKLSLVTQGAAVRITLILLVAGSPGSTSTGMLPGLRRRAWRRAAAWC